MSNNKPIIVVSASRFFQGGAIVMTAECLKALDELAADNYSIKAIVFKKYLYPELKNVEYIEIPDIRKYFLKRMYVEYIKFNKLSEKWKPFLWLSMQDSTPKVKAEKQAVYFHNALLSHNLRKNKLFVQPRIFALKWLYENVYTQNIEKNDYIICQQQNVIDILQNTRSIDTEKFLLFPPIVENPFKEKEISDEQTTNNSEPYKFIFPATGYFYKKFNTLLKATKMLLKKRTDFTVTLTITGKENPYTKRLYRNYACENVIFSGFQPRNELLKQYLETDCMVFPSEIETWGLPLSEFSQLNKPIICAGLPYAFETLAGYQKVKYFDQQNPVELMHWMDQAIDGKLTFDKREFHANDKINSWKELFEKMGLQIS